MNQWFYKASDGEEHGPFAFSRLEELAREYKLSPRCLVRSTYGRQWVLASELPQLFRHWRAEDEEALPDEFWEEDSDVDDLGDEIVLELRTWEAEEVSPTQKLPTKPRENQPAPPKTRAGKPPLEPPPVEKPPTPRAVPGSEPNGKPPQRKPLVPDLSKLWLCKILGVELGPMPLSDLERLAREGELEREDQVRRADQPDWQPAKSVETLTSILPPAKVETPPSKSSPNGQPPEQTKKPEPKKKVSPPKESMEDWLAKAVPAPIKPVPLHAPPPAPLQTPPKPIPATPTVSSFAEPPPSPPPPRPVWRKEPDRPAWGARLSDLKEKLRENPKAFIILAAVVVLAILFLPWPFGNSDGKYHDQITAIGNTFKEMCQSNAPPAEFAAFKSAHVSTLVALRKELEKKGAGSKDRPKQEMLWACEKLKELLEGGAAKAKSYTEERYDQHMDLALKLIEGTFEVETTSDIPPEQLVEDPLGGQSVRSPFHRPATPP